MNIQKKIVRLMTFKSYLEHTEPIFKELGILDIFKINYYLTAMFMFFVTTILRIYQKFLKIIF
jgi:hypothetical protein